VSSRPPVGVGRTPVYRLLGAILRPFLVVVTRPRWSGEEHLRRSGGYVVAANHMSNIDPLTTAQFLYVRGRVPKIMAKDSLWRIPVFGWFLRRTGMIPVHRNTAGAADSLVSARGALRAGECVLVFPEGTLTKDPELWPMAAKSGVARLALGERVPVVPVAHWGAQDVLPQHGRPRLRLRKPVTVRAGEPVDLSDLYDLPVDAATLGTATRRVMDAVTTLLEEIRGQQAPAEYDPRRQERVRQRGTGQPRIVADAPSSTPAEKTELSEEDA